MKSCLRGFAVAVMAIGFAWAGPQAAWALPFTLDQQITINQSGVVGTIDPVFDVTGGLGPLTSGATDFALNDIVVFDLTLAVGSASIGGVDLAVSPGGFFEPIGAGTFAGAGQAPSAVFHIPLDPIFFTGGVGSFTFLPNQIDAGETTVRLFVTYSLGTISEGDGANFMISSGADFTVNGGIVIVPEPSAPLLYGCGLLVLGAASRRSRKPH